MSESSATPRIVTVPTLDHGLVSVPEPTWCTGHRGRPPGFRVDLTHTGREHALEFGDGQLSVAVLSQTPYASTDSPDVCLYVEQPAAAYTLDPAGAERLAAAYANAAARLRFLARELAAARGGEAGR